MNKTLVGLCAAVLATASCINWDGQDGAEDIYCRHRPSVCDPSSVQRVDGGTQYDGGSNVGGEVGTGGGDWNGGSNGTFDPDEIHLWGTLTQGLCGREALCNLKSPDKPAVGFDCNDSAWDPVIRPDGKLVYADDDGNVRQFVADPLKVDAKGWIYPSNPQANDIVLLATPCELPGSVDFRVAADTGALWVNCSVWTGPNNRTLRSGDALLSVGAGGNVLLEPWDSLFLVVEASDGTRHTTSLSWLDLIDVRATTGGFYVALEDSSSHPDKLYKISTSGAVTEVGSYADTSRSGPAIMDSDGALYYRTSAGGPDEIVRVPLQPGSETIVYTEDGHTELQFNNPQSKPYTFMHGSILFTGP